MMASSMLLSAANNHVFVCGRTGLTVRETRVTSPGTLKISNAPAMRSARSRIVA